MNPVSAIKNQAFRIISYGPVLVVFALLLASCGNPASDRGSKPGALQSTAAPDTAAPNTAAPATEGTGPEPPPPAGNGPPAIEIASLPIGGGADDDTSVHQCVGVSWLDTDIPDHISVLVTAVRIEPAGIFAQSTSGCDRPLCRPSFAFTSNQGTCYVPVNAKGPAGASARLYLDGTVRCPAGQRPSCEALVAKVKKQSIQLRVPDELPPAHASPSPSTS